MSVRVGWIALAVSAIGLPRAAWAYEYVEDPSDFATEVTAYDRGDPVPYDWIWDVPFEEPESALGRPTVDTTGDWEAGPPSAAVTVLPVYAPFRVWELVSIGEGGYVILKFDHPVVDDPRNPCGVDFIVYGNASQSVASGAYWLNGDPNGTVVNSASVLTEASVVSVAQFYDPAQPQNTVWYTFTNGPGADMWAPTLGRIYDENAPLDPPQNGWWGDPTHPLIPFNPALTPADFQGGTVAHYAQRYGYGAGGTSFDVADVGVGWFQYVRISNPPGSGVTPELDAVADVDPEAPAPDFDCDTDVDADDVAALLACDTGPALGPPLPGCERMDLDDDGDVDQVDFGIVQKCFSGPDVPADPNCKD